MRTVTRRSFLQFSAKLSAVMGLGAAAIPRLSAALDALHREQAPVLWLQGQSCSGCSVSLLNAEALPPAKLLTQRISLTFHQTLSAATGQPAVDLVNHVISKGDYILCVEGAAPAGMPRACVFGEEPFATQVVRAAKAARAVVAVGTCAAHGGVPAAEGNSTGAVGIPKLLQDAGVNQPLVRVPGCPVHPDWLLGTVVHLLSFGLPPLDGLGRPTAFYGRLVHDQCPRFADYEREKFAQHLGDEGCLFRLGCLGPITHADCNLRLWNGGTNACIRAGAPCVGCAGPGFVSKAGFPLQTKYHVSKPSES